MPKPREPWKIRPAKKSASVSAPIKDEVEGKARDLIETVLNPKYVQPPPKDGRFNFIIDIGAKWHGNYFYFFATYACPGPNALSPTFEARFARMELLGGGKFALYFMRHTGECVGHLRLTYGRRVHESHPGRSVVRAVSDWAGMINLSTKGVR